MASASSTSAKNLFIDSKLRLVERVKTNINSVGSVCRQIVRGSKSTELLTQASKNLTSLEQSIENTEDNLSRLQILSTHLEYQYESISKSCQGLEEAKEQIRDMQR